MWSTIKTRGLTVTLAEAQEACETYVICSREHPQKPMGTSKWVVQGQVVRGQVLLTQWQVDVIRPLPSSEGCKYAITGMHMATGFLAAYPAGDPDQKAVIAPLEQLCAADGRPLIIESDQGMRFTGTLVQ